MITEPPLSGADQEIVTIPALKLVVGATGIAGYYAARMLNEFETML